MVVPVLEVTVRAKPGGSAKSRDFGRFFCALGDIHAFSTCMFTKVERLLVWTRR